MSAAAPAIKKIRLPANLPRWYQEDLWCYMQDRIGPWGQRGLAVAHRRWGKDELSLNWTAVAAHERIGTYWHLLPEAAQARKAIWNAIDEETGKRRIDQAFPEELRASTHEQEMFIRFKHGSTWQVVGSDNYNSLVGSPPVGVVMSEWALANPAAWAYLSPILEKNGGWALFIYTPRGKNHGHRFYQLSQQKDSGWYGIRQTVEDTDVFKPAQLTRIRSELVSLYGEEDGESLYEQEYNCSFNAAVIGAYYGRIIARLESAGRITHVPHDPSYPVYTAHDIGLDDAHATWFAQHIGREWRIIDYYEARNRALVDIARDILAKPYNYARHWFPHDIDAREITSARTRKETLENIGLRPIHAGTKRDPSERINAVRIFLTRCVFDHKCEKGLDALRSYRVDYDEKNQTPRKNPLHNWASHPADAFGELAMQADSSGVRHRQIVAQGDYDPFSLAKGDYSQRINSAANPIPNVTPAPTPAPVTDWDPFEVEYR
jgi:phage terminase large subunit